MGTTIINNLGNDSGKVAVKDEKSAKATNENTLLVNDLISKLKGFCDSIITGNASGGRFKISFHPRLKEDNDFSVNLTNAKVVFEAGQKEEALPKVKVYFTDKSDCCGLSFGNMFYKLARDINLEKLGTQKNPFPFILNAYKQNRLSIDTSARTYIFDEQGNFIGAQNSADLNQFKSVKDFNQSCNISLLSIFATLLFLIV